jgi:hypothetical protein
MMPLPRLEMDAMVAVGPWQIDLPTAATRGEETFPGEEANGDNIVIFGPVAHSHAVSAVIEIRVKEHVTPLGVRGGPAGFDPQGNGPAALQYQGVHQALVQQEVARESAIHSDAVPEPSRFIVDTPLPHQWRSHFALCSLDIAPKPIPKHHGSLRGGAEDAGEENREDRHQNARCSVKSCYRNSFYDRFPPKTHPP